MKNEGGFIIPGGANGHSRNGSPTSVRHKRPKMPGKRARSNGSQSLITGGAGFIGTNVADRLLENGRRVLLLDNLSRPGVERNWHWLRDKHGDAVQMEVADVRDRKILRQALRHADEVFHFAAQVAVTSSLNDPVHDFEVNARGTLNLLEELRILSSAGDAPPLLFTSTNKVYGALERLALRQTRSRYEPSDSSVREYGVSETCNLDFYSPYGCSKGMADQMVHDYARSFGLQTVVFRMSCIYGPHQCGTEDQGWVAHFLIRTIEGKPITLYGDGLQVRDLLFVDDLVNAMLLAQQHMGAISGQAFNIGGGPRNTVSLVELMRLIAQLHDGTPRVEFSKWRTGDQRYFTADTRRFSQATGWSPKVQVEDGVRQLYEWLRRNRREHASTNVPNPVSHIAKPKSILNG